ncbi:hypothetical protein FB567DRAFT_605258 [Paraphoma chrysanthemicola]|uniref:4-amino-5-hydroxymethyl-2-methylpyrimidine phosphate synthase n=1 Tax=Paraphoma chrysanthemicola TaxID=798071 RepID=A0A8K0R0F3_9PLEO|nr:hypothetical protein FB567DRAFT_605258 [Paraphoma chrysanthemicola]
MQPFRLTATGYNLSYLPEYIALRHGFFREQGLDVTVNIPTPWDGVLDALHDGTADMALGGIWVPSMYRNRVQDYTVFAQIANRCPLALLTHGNAKEFKLSDVPGKTVLMKSGGGASVGLFFKMLLREKGLDERSVDYIQDLDGKMLGDLFQGGMGDYFVTDNLSALAMVAKNPKVSIAMEMVAQGDIPWSVYYPLEKGIAWVLEHDAESFRNELAELFPNVPVDVAVSVTNGFRRDGMWTSTSIPRAGARLVDEPLAFEEIVDDAPASAARSMAGTP